MIKNLIMAKTNLPHICFFNPLQYIIHVTLNTKFDTIWLSRVCAKTTCLNLMRPFAHESSLTRVENDAPYNLTDPCFDPPQSWPAIT